MEGSSDMARLSPKGIILSKEPLTGVWGPDGDEGTLLVGVFLSGMPFEKSTGLL